MDVVSKYLFISKLKHKNETCVLSAFKSLVSKIKNKKLSSGFNLGKHMVFWGDFGTEFQFKSVKEFLLTQNINLFNSGTPGKKKLPTVERTIRTIREKLNFNRQNVKNNDEFIIDLIKSINIYNNSKHSSTKQAPNVMLEKNIILDNPIPKDFDYHKNKVCLHSQKHYVTYIFRVK